MGWLNGKHQAASAVTPAAGQRNDTVTGVGANPVNGNGTSKELTIARTNGAPRLARLVPDIESAIAIRDVLVEAVKRLMVRDTDYGTIKGTNRDTLLQPGADKLANLFQLVVRYEILEKEEDWTGERHGGEAFFYYVVAGKAWMGDALMGEGIGSCNSWEEKYRWRNAERTCPQCGKATIIKGREEYGGGWVCFARKGGCGAKFYDGDASVEDQPVGKKANPNAADLPNTIMKMAFKRSKISTVINATSASEFFTQDVEDFTAPEDHIDTGGFRPGTSQAAQYVANQKIANRDPHSRNVPWKNMRELAECFKSVRERVGETEWLKELERWGWRTFTDLRNAVDSKDAAARKAALEKAGECYWHLDAIARGGDQ